MQPGTNSLLAKIEIPYSVRIIDDPETDLIVLLAKSQYPEGKPHNSIRSISRKELEEALLGEHRYNIIAWTINRLTKEIRHQLEHEVVNPILKLEKIILPQHWSSYKGPDRLIDQQSSLTGEEDYEGQPKIAAEAQLG